MNWPTLWPVHLPDCPSQAGEWHANLKDAIAETDVTDVDNDPKDIVLRISNWSGLDQGWIEINGEQIPKGGVFTLQDVLDGKVTYHQHLASGATLESQIDTIKFEVVDRATTVLWDSNGNIFELEGGIYDPAEVKSGGKLKEFELTFNLNPGAGGGEWTAPNNQFAPNTNTSEWAGENWGVAPSKGTLVEGGSIILGNGSEGGQPGLQFGVKDNSAGGAAVAIPATDIVYTITSLTFRDNPADPDNTESGEWNGSLYRTVGGNKVALYLGSTFTQDDLDKGYISFEHDGSEDFHSTAHFDVSAGLGVTWKTSFDFFITPVNDLPTVVGSDDNVVSEGPTATQIAENGAIADARAFLIKTEHLHIADPDDANSSDDYAGLESGSTLSGGTNYAYNNQGGELRFQVTDLPDHGKLQYLDGGTWKDVALNQILPASLIKGDGTTGLRYLHDGSEGTYSDKFTVVSIDRHNVVSALPDDVSFIITPFNDTPEIAKTPRAEEPEGHKIDTATGAEGGHNAPISGVIEGATGQPLIQIDNKHLQAVDADNAPDGVTYTITSAPTSGTLYFVSNPGDTPKPIGVGGFFTQKDIDDGKIYYGNHGGKEPTSGYNGTPADGAGLPDPDVKFGFSISDGTAIQKDREFWIYVNPTNDAPTVSAGGDRILVPNGGVKVGGGFEVKDPDSAQKTPEFFDDKVRVTIRLSQGDNGSPLSTQDDYAGVTIKSESANTGVTVVGGYDGNGKPVIIEGTLAQVNAYLDGLHLTIANPGFGNQNKDYRIDVIVDDRTRDGSGNLISGGKANGGKNLDNTKTGEEAPSVTEVNPYGTSVTEIENGPLNKNVDISHRKIFVSNENEAPQANPDVNRVTEVKGTTAPNPTTTGNVITGGSSEDKKDTDTDQFDTLTVVEVKFGSETKPFNDATEVTIKGKYGELTLKKDGGYTYELNNNHPEVKALKPGSTPLEETFDYKITDNNASKGENGSLTASTTLKIIIDGVDDARPAIVPNDKTPDIAGDNVVSEGGLPGGHGPVDSQKTTGTIKVTADAGVDKISITKGDGGTVTLDVPRLEKLTDLSGGFGPVSIDTVEGTLILTKFERVETKEGVLSEAELSYEYILKEKQTHPENNDYFDTIPLGVVDKEGDTNTGNLIIKIEDDAPKAFDNFEEITEDHSTNAVSGNVVNDVGPGGADSIGADGPKEANKPVTSVKFDAKNLTFGTEFTSAYGKIVINPDGSYTYTLDNNNPDVNGLLTGQTLTETFDYTITDSDGDTASAKLVITIKGTTDTGSNIQIIGGSNAVYESGLRSDTDADNRQKTDVTKTHVIDVVSLDGIGKVEIGGKSFDVDALKQLSPSNSVEITTSYGKLKLTGFKADETHDGSENGIPTKGKISYEYEIVAGQTHDKNATPTKDIVFDDVIPLKVIGYKVLDKDPAESTGDLTIKIYDDVPEARNDTADVVEDGTTEAKGNVLDNDEPGGDGLIDKPVINVRFGGTDYTPGSKIKTPYGEITLNDDGTYTYILDNYSPAVQNLQQGQLVHETVRYTIKDKDGDISEANLVITITGSFDGGTATPEVPVNKAPVVVPPVDPRELERADVDSQDIVPVDVSKYFKDPEGGKLTYTVEGLPPSLVYDPETGKITGAPHHSASQQGAANNGVYDVKVTATDPQGASSSFNFKWTVSNVPPYAKDDVARTSPTEIVSGNVVRGDERGFGRDGDPDQDPFIVSYINNTGVGSNGASIQGSNGGTFTVKRDGSYTFDPGSDFSGLGTTETRETSITYTIADSDGGTARATLTITVAGKDVPVGLQAIIPNSEVVITLHQPPALGPDGTPYSTPGNAGKVDEIHSDFSLRLDGSAENVVLTGHKAANVWDNASGNVIYGNAGANTIYLSGGRDVVDGGSGYDLLVLSKAKSDYSFDFSKGVAEIRDNATGFVVTAASIEGVSFNGQAVDPVRALYDAYYGREATEAEYASATTLLKDGVSVAEVGAKLAATQEAQAHIGSGSSADFIKSVYGSVLGRSAGDDEANWWAGQIDQGDFSRTEAVLRFVDSEEFGDRYVDLFKADHNDIAGLYRIVMGRDPDKEGFIFWSQRSAGGETLREIALDFYYSDEFQARISSTSHTDLVTDFYADLLRREPDADGLAYWVGELDRDQRTAANVAQSILESDEFRQNVDTLLNRAEWLDLF